MNEDITVINNPAQASIDMLIADREALRRETVLHCIMDLDALAHVEDKPDAVAALERAMESLRRRL